MTAMISSATDIAAHCTLTEALVNSSERRFPMSKPQNHAPAIQRYSSHVPTTVTQLQVLVFGVQFGADQTAAEAEFLSHANALFDNSNGPCHRDFARFTDPQQYRNTFAVAYWQDVTAYTRWRADAMRWWDTLDPAVVDVGYWLETFEIPVEYRETIAFKEYIRGLSACPMAHIEPMDESGYWGAARDRIPASCYDRFDPAPNAAIHLDDTFSSKQRRVRTPSHIAVIRSGVSWLDCGQEQLDSYRANIAPKLDTGMEYLRQNPEQTGCYSLRQVDCIGDRGETTQEAYSLGYFLSLEHLERWSKEHPTHLAIYTRAQAERRKYQERLELRTYHEVYVVKDEAVFEYINCHNRTGLIPFAPDRPEQRSLVSAS